jgi:N-acetylneuraminic acid mutarotase
MQRRSFDLETIEPRLLLDAVLPEDGHGGTCACSGCGVGSRAAGLLMPQATGPKLNLNINFQPQTNTSVPPGFRADIGRAFGKRANGLSYGWTTSMENQAVDRNDARAPDDRYDAFMRMTNGQKWEIAVPNGSYEVTVVSGDPSNLDAEYRLEVEGNWLLRGRPTDRHRWIEGHGIVQVDDGRLTISSYAGSFNNNIAFVMIRSSAATPSYQIGRELQWREESASVPFGRIEAGTVQFGNELFVFGGFGDKYDYVWGRVDALNVDSQKWRRATSLPGAQTHFGVATDGRFIYIAGGQYGAGESRDGTNEVWRYDPVKNRWNRSIDLPDTRFAGTLAYWNNELHFFGGAGADRVTSTNTHWVLKYNEVDRGWQKASPMPRVGDHMGATVMNNRIYLIGGEHGHGVSYVQHDNVFEYNPTTDSWREMAPMPSPSSHFEANVLQYDGRIWVVGGMTQAWRVTNEVRSFDPVRNTWRIHESLPDGRKGGYGWISNGRMFYAAGEVEGGSESRTIFSTTLLNELA